MALTTTPASTTRSFERRAMGSPLRLTVVGAADGAALVAWGVVSAEFELAEQAMSRFREASDLTSVNRAAGSGRPIEVDRRLRRALVAAWRAQRVTAGRFDARVLPDLERLGYRGVTLAGVDGLRARPAPPDATARPWLRTAGRGPAVAVDAPVDLGGIGKGLALRWAWAQARARLDGPVGLLLEAGGDLVAAGPSPDGGPWHVGIEDPGASDGRAGRAGRAGTPLAVLEVTAGAVCTSSVAVHRRRSADGRLVHHLVDPRTGEPGGAGLLAVTVAGPDPAWAEVWSKTLFLEGADGIAAAARRRGLATWWVTEDGDLRMTPGARPLTAWTAGATA